MNSIDNINLIIDDESALAAVLIPLIEVNGEPHVLFEVRASNLPDQPGDVCLPGGMIEEGESPEEAAIRETSEELCIDKSQIEDISPAKVFQSPSITIFPFFARLKNYSGTFSNDEVSEVFTVPLSFFETTKPEKHMVKWNRTPDEDFPYEKIVGGRNYKWRKQQQAVLFYEYEGHVIWGNTARIIYYNFRKEK